MRLTTATIAVCLMVFSVMVLGQADQPANAVKGTETTGAAQKSGTVTDIDGNVYQTVTIGTQVWMAENLRVTHYRDGDSIPSVADNAAWAGLTTGASCGYEDNPDNVAAYGKLYTWNAVNDSRKISPEGWHVPTDVEWRTLIDFLGGAAVAGGKLKDTGLTHWQEANATNESGFSALPGGCRDSDGSFYFVGATAYLWTSTERDSDFAYYHCLYNSLTVVDMGAYNKRVALSVRCIKD